jgi:hypothetical protein
MVIIDLLNKPSNKTSTLWIITKPVAEEKPE